MSRIPCFIIKTKIK